MHMDGIPQQATKEQTPKAKTRNNEQLIATRGQKAKITLSTSTPKYIHERLNNSEYFIYPLLVPPYVPLRTSFVLAKKYNIAACRIQKNLSTILWSIFCFLNNKEFYTTNNISLTARFRTIMKYDVCNATEVTGIGNNRYNAKIAILRDPLERFLSAFVDKCIREAEKNPTRCYGCKGDMVCLLEKQYYRFMRIAAGEIKEYSFEDRHFAPMTWFCDFNKHNIKTFDILTLGETEKHQAELIDKHAEIFSKNHVEKNLTDYIQKEVRDNPTPHSTTGSDIRKTIGNFMRTNQKIMSLLQLLYANDYTVFNIPSPFLEH
ncbi:unnamed protein product [Caenorhabditis bovis]|uniref:Uncharacterized protein n=1 Tax=Caenorhabditis bovis TaxID=2654633 RepID=A0A8S1FCW0_9PELO|nr:unnamed protein product [Caenorhabditis bovis]